ncbi:probable Fumarylacetoacetase [Cephalotrichum gorgonifer]|uniref:Fumarylacetoacetase n=1 Tax=Cephalotrichum gorgonifer TaxID=2041049 RepID=A0AAE8SY10_9PEZI|nr:probable Fumarylacetoacetase [Cephalotrichum gorgonifer]
MARSWLSISPGSPFSLANIPFGIISTQANPLHRPAIAIGDLALDLDKFASNGGFSELPSISQHLAVFSEPTLNDFAALGRNIHHDVRTYIQQILQEDGKYPAVLKDNPQLRDQALLPLPSVQNHLPLKVGDYTDFYVGLNHAYNVGVLFRGPDNALQPNYKHLPIIENPTATPKVPILRPSRKLDIELELAAFVCKPNELGDPIRIDRADEHIFGFVLMNDWSARDVQYWEYVPLGPFTSKNFGTTISPWVVLTDALEPFRTRSRVEDSQHRDGVLPYLREKRADTAYDIRFQVAIQPAGLGADGREIFCTGNARDLLFSFPQLVTHHTVTGCNLNTGDLLASGTISGVKLGTFGSFLEATKNGKEPLALKNGETRTFLQDGDGIIITGAAGNEGHYVGFGECAGVILPVVTYE